MLTPALTSATLPPHVSPRLSHRLSTVSTRHSASRACQHRRLSPGLTGLHTHTPGGAAAGGGGVDGTVAAAVAATRSKKKAAQAAQQLWHEWAAENLAAMGPQAQRARLPADTKLLVASTSTSKLVQVSPRDVERQSESASEGESLPADTKLLVVHVHLSTRPVLRGGII
jgi:hypothetical protein